MTQLLPNVLHLFIFSWHMKNPLPVTNCDEDFFNDYFLPPHNAPLIFIYAIELDGWDLNHINVLVIFEDTLIGNCNSRYRATYDILKV